MGQTSIKVCAGKIERRMVRLINGERFAVQNVIYGGRYGLEERSVCSSNIQGPNLDRAYVGLNQVRWTVQPQRADRPWLKSVWGGGRGGQPWLWWNKR